MLLAMRYAIVIETAKTTKVGNDFSLSVSLVNFVVLDKIILTITVMVPDKNNPKQQNGYKRKPEAAILIFFSL